MCMPVCMHACTRIYVFNIPFFFFSVDVFCMYVSFFLCVSLRLKACTFTRYWFKELSFPSFWIYKSREGTWGQESTRVCIDALIKSWVPNVVVNPLSSVTMTVKEKKCKGLSQLWKERCGMDVEMERRRDRCRNALTDDSKGSTQSFFFYPNSIHNDLMRGFSIFFYPVFPLSFVSLFSSF